MSKIAVVGGGPAGMMAAYAAARQGQVWLFEKNEKLGKKLFLTGKGRCNITNAAEMQGFFSSVRRNEKFLYSAFYGFTNQDLFAAKTKWAGDKRGAHGEEFFRFPISRAM